ncbi:hypothetical protein ACQKJZ_19260 [Sphingomonas sp. NPDC019816]|uniref:hypothetical protein n=1 Tax=Sphingomonas sp. NPDC019816 TaxID=3390679 RepID=UPI003CFFA9BD
MVDPTDPKKPRPPRRRTSPKTAGGATPRKRPAAKPPEAETPSADTSEQTAVEAPRPAAKPKAPPKPRSTKRTTPRKASPRTPTPIKPAPAPALGKHGLDRVGGKWGVASILGSLAAFAGVTAALLSLRGSSAKRDDDGERQGD